MTYRVGVVYICTGRYVVFWPGFYEAAEKHFMPGHEIHYYVFTDTEHVLGETSNPRIHRIPLAPEPWPYGTLRRFSYMLQHEESLRENDYIYFMNSNLEMVADIEAEMALPIASLGQSLVVVQHPGYVRSRRKEFPYETRATSCARIRRGEGDVYVCGGINGGTAGQFLQLARDLDRRIGDDEKRGVIALWHDESHLNRYIIDRRDVRVLPPSFCYPVGWKSDFPELIRLREKTKLIDEAVFKGWETGSPPLSKVARMRRLAGGALRGVTKVVRRAG